MTFMEHHARGFHNTPIRGENGPSPSDSDERRDHDDDRHP